MKVVVAALNQEKALAVALSVIVQLQTFLLEALHFMMMQVGGARPPCCSPPPSGPLVQHGGGEADGLLQHGHRHPDQVSCDWSTHSHVTR